MNGKISQKVPKYSGKILFLAASCRWVSEEELMLLEVVLQSVEYFQSMVRKRNKKRGIADSCFLLMVMYLSNLLAF